MGGGAILDHCIVKIMVGKRTVYEQAGYHSLPFCTSVMASELESEEHQEALKYPEKYIFKVDIKGTTPVLVDGGTLFVRKRGGEKHGNE
jgi:hypothetical protein